MSAEGIAKRIAEKWADEYILTEEPTTIESVVESAIREALLAVTPYLHHLDGCGGYHSPDALSRLKWEGSEKKWRDCTCGLAEIMGVEEEAQR